MIEREQVVVGARVRTEMAVGEITEVDANGIATIRWDFGLSFAYAYNPEAKRLEVFTGQRKERRR